MVRIFIWAARLPAVAVGLSAVLASLVPLLSLPRPSLGAVSVYSILSRAGVLQETHSPFFRGIHAVRCYLPVSVPRLAVGRIPSPDCTPLRSVCQGLLRLRFSETRYKCGAGSPHIVARRRCAGKDSVSPPFRCRRQEATESPRVERHKFKSQSFSL